MEDQRKEKVKDGKDKALTESDIRLQSQLQEKSIVVEELEECFVENQLAVHNAILVNERLKTETIDSVGTMYAYANGQENGVQAGADQIFVTRPVTMVNGAEKLEYYVNDVKDLVGDVQWLKMQLQQAINTLHMQNVKQKDTVAALQNAHHEMEVLQLIIMHKDEFIAKLASKINEIASEYSVLKQNFADLERTKADAEAHLLIMKDQTEGRFLAEIEQLKFQKDAEIQSLTKEFDKKIMDFSVSQDQMLAELNDIDRKYRTEKEEEHRLLLMENDSLKSKCVTLTKGLEYLKVKHEHSDTELTNLSVEFATLRKEYDMLLEIKGQCELLHDDVKKFEAEKQELSEQILEATSLKQNVEAELNETVNQLKMLKTENLSLKNDNTLLDNEITKLKNDNSFYMLHMSDCERKSADNKDLFDENHSLRVQNDELYNKINNQLDAIATIKTEFEVITLQNTKFSDQLKDMFNDVQHYKNEANKLIVEKEDFLKEITNLKCNLHAMEEENAQYKVININLSEEIQHLKHHLSDYTDKLKSIPVTELMLTKYEVAVNQCPTALETQCEVKDKLIKESTSNLAATIPKRLASIKDLVSRPAKNSDTDFTHGSDILSSNFNDDPPNSLFTLTDIATLNENNHKKDKKIKELQQQLQNLTAKLLEISMETISAHGSEISQPKQHNQSDAVMTLSAMASCDLSTNTDDDTAYGSMSKENTMNDQKFELAEASQFKEKINDVQMQCEHLSKLLCSKTKECELLQSEMKTVRQLQLDDAANRTLEAPSSVQLTDFLLSNMQKVMEGNVGKSFDAFQKLDDLKLQYESQLVGLQYEIEKMHKEQNRKEEEGIFNWTGDLQKQFRQVKEELSHSLSSVQKEQLDVLVTGMERQSQQQLEDIHTQHLDDINGQLNSLRCTLEEINKSQVTLLQSELEQSHQTALLELQNTLQKHHKEEINKLQQEWSQKLDKLQLDYERALSDSRGDTIDKEESEAFISSLNQRLTEEHQQIIQKLEADQDMQLSPQKQHPSRDSKTHSDVLDVGTIATAPLTNAENKAPEDKQKVIRKAEDVQKSLVAQTEEITALRAKILKEYQQMLSVRVEIMSSQSQEVEKLQQEIQKIQQQFEQQVKTFQDKVHFQAEIELNAAHAKELEEIKQYYETKVSEMEQSYSSDITQLKQEHEELLIQLHKEMDTAGSSLNKPSSVVSSDKHQRTLMAIPDEDEESLLSSKSSSNLLLESRIKLLEDKLKDKDKMISQLKQRLEAESTSAEDLHSKLLDNNNTLGEYEESLKAKIQEIEELKNALTIKDHKIKELEHDKAALEEKGEKDETSSEGGDSKIIKELKEKIQKFKKELGASKDQNVRIQQELNQLDLQHGEAIMKLKEEMINLNRIKIEELNETFNIQLEEELKQQADELSSKYMTEIHQYNTELIFYKNSEKELKEKLNALTAKMKQLQVVDEVQENNDLQVASPSQTVDREELETTIRAEILQKYEQSIDTLKNEYEARINDLNTRISDYELHGEEKGGLAVKDKDSSGEEESEIKESLRAELALEFKEKLQRVTDEYESKLKQLQDKINDGTIYKLTDKPYPLKRSRSCDVIVPREQEKKIPNEYEGYVSTIRREYEDKIKSLQREIAHYHSSIGTLPLSSLKVMSQKSLSQENVKSPDAEPSHKLDTQEIRQEIHDEINKEFEVSFSRLRSDYEKQLQDLTGQLSALESDNALCVNIENKLQQEYNENIAQLKHDHEEKIAKFKQEYEIIVNKLTKDLEQAKSEKLSAEQKVKADMFVWHEETVTQLKRKHEEYITQLRKEYEEKMELYREELQEEFDAEKDSIVQGHKNEIAQWEDRYDNLVEGIRTGEAPDVADIVQQRYDMELDVAKTLMQQECDETIEAEQIRLTEQYEEQMQGLIAKKDQELEEQKIRYEKEIEETKNIILQQYHSQIIELQRKHAAAVTEAKMKYDKDNDGDYADHDDNGVNDDQSVVRSKTSDILTQEHILEISGKIDREKSKSHDAVDMGEEIAETIEKETAVEVHTGQKQVDSLSEESEVVTLLRQELQEKIAAYEATISQQNAHRDEEICQLTEELSQLESEYQERIKEMEEKHQMEIEGYEERLFKLRDSEETEALEIAHQQELHDVEDRLVQKHTNEINNLETQYHLKLDDLEHKCKVQVEQLQQELIQAHKLLEQYESSSLQTVPSFHGEGTMESTVAHQKESPDDFMALTLQSSADTPRSDIELEGQVEAQESMETQVFVAGSIEDRSELDEDTRSVLQGTLEDDVGIHSFDTSMDQYRGSLRGVDDTQDTELIEFSEEDSDKSIDEATESQKSDPCSTPIVLLQTLAYGAEIPDGPTVKSLDDTTDSSTRMSDREELVQRIKELEREVKELRYHLQSELSKQDDLMEQMDHEKQEESNMAAMLQADIERLNQDRNALQKTNEHLLGLLSDTVKTYMNIDESITKRMKLMTEKQPEALKDKSVDNKSQRSAERKIMSSPHKRSPGASPGRLSPARAEDGDGAHETSVLSNITDEGLDLSQRISDSIFQGPELASDEEELLMDSGSRLHSSVSCLLDMLEETTNQLLHSRENQVDMMETLEGKGHSLEHLTSRCNDLEERLKEEVERKDFLVLELHKAEGLIEGYTSEQETMENQIKDLEEQKETLVLELETMKNKLRDLESMQSEYEQLKREIENQQKLLTNNIGVEAQALLLEVHRVNAESRQKEEVMKQACERYEAKVRELETNGEDMESHYGKLLEEKKQELADLKQQVEALEKQLKVKKQFIEEQSAEREQEHEDYQKELNKWKKIVQDIEKQNDSGSRLHREIDDLTEQLESRNDLYKLAMQDIDMYKAQLQEKDLNLTEHKSLIQQLEHDLQEKANELGLCKQKLVEFEVELSRKPYHDDDLSNSSKSEMGVAKSTSSLEFDDSMDQKRTRMTSQMTFEEEMWQAAEKTKEELVREKHALQTQVNDLLFQISGLRNQLDDMRHRRGIDEVPDARSTLKHEREKSEEKDTEIAGLRLKIEQLEETVTNREQQIKQLHEQRDRTKSTRYSPVEFESDKEMEKQMEALKRENRQLREQIKLMEMSSVSDMSGLSENLLQEKNQVIDQLSEQLLHLQSEFSDLKAQKGVENVYDEVEALRLELSLKDKELMELQSIQVSRTFTDNSLTPDMTLNVGASFSEKASIQQEMEESVSNRLEKMAGLESELLTLKTILHSKEELILDLQNKQKESNMYGDVNMLQALIQEKEELIIQLNEQVDSLQIEVQNLSDFQNKLQEDFDTVQAMLEKKDGEIESLTKELTEKTAWTDEHTVVIKHEVEITRLKKEVREKGNVIEEKMEELAELSDKVELLESHIEKYKEQVKDYDDQILEKERDIKKLNKQLLIQSDNASLADSKKDKIIQEKSKEIERLSREIESISLRIIPSPSFFQDDKSDLILQQKNEIEGLRTQLEAATLGRPPSPPDDEDQSDVISRLTTEIERLKQQIMDTNLSEDDKFVLIRELRFENEMLRKQVDAALKIRPPSPPLDEDEKSKLITQQKSEIQDLKKQISAALKIKPPSPPLLADEKLMLIKEQQKEIKRLQKQVEEALEIVPPPPPLSEDLKDKIIEQIRSEMTMLRTELRKVTEAFENGEDQSLLLQKIDEVIQLQKTMQDSKIEMEVKNEEIKRLQKHVKKLEKEMQSVKEVKSYEDEIELKEKQDEIDELQAELERYRSRTESSLTENVDLNISLDNSITNDSKQFVRNMSFYKDQYEEKCSEARQLKVQLDLVKHQLEKARSEKIGDAHEEIEMFKADLERKVEAEIHELKETNKKVCKEKEMLLKELDNSNRQDSDESAENVNFELQLLKDELAKERMDTVQAIKDLETLRDRKEKERKDFLKTIQELEQEKEEKITKEKELNTQVKQLSEELTFFKRQYGIEEKTMASKSKDLKAQGSFELGTDIETLHQQVLHYKQHSDKAREYLAEKQKYQSQVVKLEIQYEQLQRQMKKDISALEEQLKSYSMQSDKDVWTQLHATQERLDNTTVQLGETGKRLSETEASLNRVSEDLNRRNAELKELQQKLHEILGQFSVTSEKLQETEEKLRMTVGCVTEREDQIHQLQTELQHMQQEAEQFSNVLSTNVDKQEEVEKLRKQLKTTQVELEEVKKSLQKAVHMSEQQVQMVENKDHEYIKLKLDIQQTIADKEKTMKEQKQKLQEQDQTLYKVRQELQGKEAEVSNFKQQLMEREKIITALTKQIEKLKISPASEMVDGCDIAGGDMTTVATLKAQLQNQEEVIALLQTTLHDAQRTIQENHKEIDNIRRSSDQAKNEAATRIEELHKEIDVINKQFNMLRSSVKAQGDQSKSSEVKEQSAHDQNGRLANNDETYPSVRVSPTSGQTQHPNQYLDDPEDSGNQSLGTTQSWVKSPRFSPRDQSKLSLQRPGDLITEQNSDNNILDPKYLAASSSQPALIDQHLAAQDGRSLSSRQSSSFCGQIEEIPICPDVNDGTGASFFGHGEKSPPIGFELSERYVGEDGHLYDTDGNLRPHHLQEVKGQSQVGKEMSQSVSQTLSGKNVQDAECQRTLDRQDGCVEDGSGPRISVESDGCIQQLRRELLIAKTALMQIQRGEHLDDRHIDDEIDELDRDRRAELRYDTVPTAEIRLLRQRLKNAEEEITLYKTTSGFSTREFVQKVTNLKDELTSEHQRHIKEMVTRAQQDTEMQLAAMRMKYTDEIERIKDLHAKELKEKLHDLQQQLQRKHKREANKLVLRHQEEVGLLKTRAGMNSEHEHGLGVDYGMVNGHGPFVDPMSDKLKNILHRLHNEGVQVLTISELELLRHNQSQAELPQGANIESMKIGWENERQSLLSTIQSLKDLLAQTHKLHGFDKNLEGSDWRAELLRAIGYVFSKERDTLLAELRSHVLSHPTTNIDEVQRLEQKIRSMESHHHSALDQIFSADRQSMLAEIRDLHAHATVSRMHQHEEHERHSEKLSSTEDLAYKKEKQLKRQVQLLEFKIQQEKVLQEDLRISLDAERNHSGELAAQLNSEKGTNLDLQSSVAALHSQISKLQEALEREQSRYLSVTNALEEEKSKSLNLSEELESERQSIWQVQSELESLRQQQQYVNPRVVEQLQKELSAEHDRCSHLENQQEISRVTIQNLRQDVEMARCHHSAVEAELTAKISQLQKSVDSEKQKQEEIMRALDRERSMSAHLQQSLEAEQSRSDLDYDQNKANFEDLKIQLEMERANHNDLNSALKCEQAARNEMESEKNLLKDHLNQERLVNDHLKQEIDKLQFERLEAVNKLQKEWETTQRHKADHDHILEELRTLKSHEIERKQEYEAEKLSSKKAVHEAERNSEDYRLKLHEQKLETQRLSKKMQALQEQLAESQENELKAIRELEQLRLEAMTVDTHAELISVQTSPREMTDGGGTMDLRDHKERLQTYRSQLESMCQSLHYLILRCREQLNNVTHSGPRQQYWSDVDTLQQSLHGLLSEVKQLKEIEGDFMSQPSGSVNERILHQNEELTNFVARISEEKTELRNTLTQLEADVWRYRQMDAKYQTMQRSSEAIDGQIIAERDKWARERLALQIAINSAEQEISHLQTNLRMEREKRVVVGSAEVKDVDKVKIQRLYGQYLREKHFKKDLIYQKNYLLLLLGGFQDTEETTLALLSRMGAFDGHSVQGHRPRPITLLRATVRVVIAIHRMKGLVNKWRRATRVGSEVVGGTVDPINGYMPGTSSFSPLRHQGSPRPISASDSSSSSSYQQQPIVGVADTATVSHSLRHNVHTNSYQPYDVTTTYQAASTPPTRDYNRTTRVNTQSSGARRKILTSINQPTRRTAQVQFVSSDAKNGDMTANDEYIKRLESLNYKIGSLQNGLNKFGSVEALAALRT